MTDVFLSYSSKDRAAAQVVQQALTAAGLDVFWDQETPAGQDWDTWIRGKLAASKVAVVLWSRSSVRSDNVRHEALVARKANKLLPAMLDPIEAEDLPMGLYMVQTTNLIDWRAPDSKSVVRLVRDVEAWLGEPASGAPLSLPRRRAPASPRSGINPVVMAVLAAALIGGAAWYFLQQKPPSEMASRAADRKVAASAPEPFSRRLVGSWQVDSYTCREGPSVAVNDSGQLVVTILGNAVVYTIESETGSEVRARVASCSGGCSVGDEYVFKPARSTASTSGRPNVVYDNLTLGLGGAWSPC